ncbi:MAG: hypothetical protein JXR96_23255 [Deltaproteobacteria bacterium]|nr:hypothetical protein [Deltaproteobacteria bacterium]
MTTALIDQLEALAARIQAGKKGVDFAVDADTCGFSRTPLEEDFDRCSRELQEEMERDPTALTARDLERLCASLLACQPAFEKRRDRTLAGGGDWTTLESAVLACFDRLCEGVQRCLAAQAAAGGCALDGLPEELLLARIGSRPLFERIAHPALPRWPALFELERERRLARLREACARFEKGTRAERPHLLQRLAYQASRREPEELQLALRVLSDSLSDPDPTLRREAASILSDLCPDEER